MLAGGRSQTRSYHAGQSDAKQVTRGSRGPGAPSAIGPPFGRPFDAASSRPRAMITSID